MKFGKFEISVEALYMVLIFITIIVLIVKGGF